MHARIPKWADGLDVAEAIASGLARFQDGVLVPVIAGAEGDEPETEPLFAAVPDDLSTLDDDALGALIESYSKAIADVAADPSEFVSADYSVDELFTETKAAVATRDAMKAALDARTKPVEVTDADAARFAELAAEETPEEPAEPAEPAEPEPAEPEAAAAEPAEAVVAAASKPVVRRRLPSPTRSREIPETQPVEAAERTVSLTAAAGAPTKSLGETFTSELDIANAMIERHRRFGKTGPGTTEQFTIALADWKDEYPSERKAAKDEESNWRVFEIKPADIMAEFTARKRAQANGAPDELVASGGLCNPVTPYYNLQFISVPQRPVMGGLPSYNADRGGLRYARPAALSAVTDAVGLITESEDAAGGSSATKTCQVIPCPDFQETDVDIIYHCLQFGNLGARAFPELVAQWNNLVLAAHARLAESNLLTQIDAFSTQVTAGALGLGASATLFSQILTAANGLRSRNRMDPEAVLRLMLPWWAVDLIISDVIRSQFQRFDTDRARVIALLRSFNIEPSFYIDSANGRAQVYGTQGDGALLPFPADVVWYLFPEASFLYLDGGTLELGIVRDSVLNKTNDFQIFGETFENVAFVGVESLAVVSTTCDSGTVSAPADVTCPVNYGT